MTIDEILLAARLRYPYFSAAYAAITLVERPKMGTVAVDKYWRLYYDQEWLDTLADDHAVNIVGYHEVNHLLRNHGERGLANASPVWNLAADAEINDDLKNGQLPDGHIHPKLVKAPEGLLAEEYVDYFEKECEGVSCGGGSGATGKPIDGELGSGSAEGDGAKDEKGTGMTAEAAEAVREMVALDTREHVKRNPDTQIPVGLRQWAEAREKRVEHNWAQELGQLVGRCSRRISRGREDYSYSRAARRPSPVVIRPGRIGYQPRIAVCADTTGSMHAQAAQVIGVMHSISRQYGNCDFFSMEMSLKKMGKRDWSFIGGGDGDFPSALRQLELKYDIVVVATDGYEHWGKPASIPVVAVMIGPSPNETPNWIKRVEVKGCA